MSSFNSATLGPKEKIITRNSRVGLADGLCGYLGRHVPRCGAPYLIESNVPLVPRSEWIDRIREMERAKSRLSDLIRSKGWTVKNQLQTNYCWVFAAAAACEVTLLIQDGSLTRLSPASVGSKVTNFRNIGGWSTRAVEYISQHGIVPTELWPDTSINRKYDTSEAWKEAAKYVVVEWLDLPESNLDYVFAHLFARLPIAAGFNWWRHAVLLLDPVYIDGKFGVRIANSWGESWSESGYGILLDNRAIPEDAVCPRAIIPR